MTDTMDKFLGKWEVTKTENMDEMLRQFDMEEEKRNMYSNMRFTMEYRRAGDDWTMIVHMGGGVTQTFNFTIGKEFNSRTLDGRPIVSMMEVKDGRFVEHHQDAADPDLNALIIREIIGKELLVKAKVKSITSITRHKKVGDN